jgi:SAM-dependent methyltransferase
MRPESVTTSRRAIERNECPICSFPANEATRESPNHLTCPSCGLLYRYNATCAVSDAWDSKYYSDDRIIEYYAKRRSGFEKIIGLVQPRVVEPRTWLDIGCGVGSLLVVADERGWKTYGIEPSVIAAAIADERVATAEIVQGVVEKGLEQFSDVTVASLIDVARYLEDPLRTLRSIWGTLGSNGWIVLRETRANLGRERRSAEAIGYEAHYPFFQEWTPDSMKATLGRAGFTDVACYPSPVFHETSGWEGGTPGRLRARMERTAKLAAGPFASIAHTMSFGRLYFTPSFITLGRRGST